MFRLDARFTAFFCVLFIVIGFFNLYMGRKRMQLQRLRGTATQAAWYKQTGMLTGIEYILLGIVLLLNMGISTGFFPASAGGIVIPLYLGALIIAAAVLLMILFRNVKTRRRTHSVSPANATQTVAADQAKQLTPEQQDLQDRHRRERRKKAAAARRRQSGRA